MTWTPDIPFGDRSVRANRFFIRNNFNYTRNTIGPDGVGANNNSTKDHFFAMGSTDLEGHHRFIKSPRFTSNAAFPNDKNPTLGPSIDSVLFPRVVSNEVARVEWFSKNSTSGVYQFIPCYNAGITNIPDLNYVSIFTVPPKTYGDIIIWHLDGDGNSDFQQQGYYVAGDTIANSFSLQQNLSISPASGANPYVLANGTQATNLNILVKRLNSGVPVGDIRWRITFRAMDAN